MDMGFRKSGWFVNNPVAAIFNAFQTLGGLV